MTVTGPRSIDQLSPGDLATLFADYLGPFAGPDTHVYLGGATGIDTAALHWLAERTPVALTVVVPATVDVQPDDAAGAITTWRARGRLTGVVELYAPRLGTDAYYARNRWMVDRSGLVIGFPHGTNMSSGTWYTLSYAAEHDKPRLIVPI